MTLLRDDPALEQPIDDLSQLVDFFRAGEKPASDFRIGTEHEKIAIRLEGLETVPFDGSNGIGAILAGLNQDPGFEPIYEGETLIGLLKDDASITLEPGGQLELSGAPLRTLHETCREFRAHVAQLNRVSEPLGVVWLGLGIQPLAKAQDIPRMPRERHDLMRSFLGARDTLGLSMMHATGTVQANFDFSSEADVARKLRAAYAITPVVTALYANSCISEGALNGFESFRAEIWRHTDPDRCGILPCVFEESWCEGSAYRAYTDWALDVPLMFIQRSNGYRGSPGVTFREFLERGFDGERATLADWNLHLTTLFPEVRLKRIIEVRGADVGPPDLICALPALWKGVFYDAEALDLVCERTAHWGFDQVDALHADVARRGLKAETPDGPTLELARELVAISRAGLERIGERNSRGETEAIFLEPLESLLQQGRNPAQELLRRWEGPFQGRLDRLVEYARY